MDKLASDLHRIAECDACSPQCFCPLSCQQGAESFETMNEVASRAAPLAEHAALGFGPLENAPVLVYCECSVRSLESRYLEAAALFGVHLQDFDKDFAAFEGVTTTNLLRSDV